MTQSMIVREFEAVLSTARIVRSTSENQVVRALVQQGLTANPQASSAR